MRSRALLAKAVRQCFSIPKAIDDITGPFIHKIKNLNEISDFRGPSRTNKCDAHPLNTLPYFSGHRLFFPDFDERKWHSQRRSYGTKNDPRHSNGQNFESVDGKWFQREVIYKGRGMTFFRLVVRTKVFQFAGVCALAALAFPAQTSNHIDLDGVTASFLLSGSIFGATSLWFFSRRYLGELALLCPKNSGSDNTAGGMLRLSTLDFWGNREETYIPIADLVPIFHGLDSSKVSELVRQPALPLQIKKRDHNGAKTFIISLRYGRIIDKEKMKNLLYGIYHTRDVSLCPSRNNT